ncbi:Hypothetical protein GLP15_5158 [Giardia lamblia P15]|uniref:Uncharacterized protein n=1 Tax=Giardia intestinalis (strain P15) TaxID=658858 RepID=E1EW90_GIAIA|nr:Hypothetical protein GLP15_5158 [Giardia lamblia P15]
MKLHIEYTSDGVTAHILCSKRPAEFLEHVDSSRFSCLIRPEHLTIDQGGQGCRMTFNTDGCRRLIVQGEPAVQMEKSTCLPEKELQRFILSTMETVRYKYSSSYKESIDRTCRTLNYLNLISANLTYLDSSHSLKLVSPLFFCSEEVCGEASGYHFEDEHLPSNLRAVETELLVLGRLIYKYVADLPCSASPLLIGDSIIHTVKHRGYSQELGRLLSTLLSLQHDQERFWPRLLSSSYASFAFLLPLNCSSMTPYDATESTISEDIELDNIISLNTKLSSFFLAAQALCNNTFRASNYNAEELLPFLIDKANVAWIIDYIYTPHGVINNCSDDIFSADDPDCALDHEDCLDIFVVLLRYSFKEFTLQDLILRDTELAQKLLSLPTNPSQLYLKTFKRIVTSLLITQQSTTLLLFAYAQQPSLFEQLLSGIQYEEVAGTLFTLIDVGSQFNDEEINLALVHCASQVNLCAQLVAAIGNQSCLSTLLSTMHLYEKLFNCHVSGLIMLAVSELPSLLTILNSYISELHAMVEVTEDLSLFMCTCFNACGKVLAIGLSLIFKTALRVATESFNFVQNETVLLWQEIEIVYPRIVYRLSILARTLVQFIDEITGSYPNVLKHSHTSRFITYLYHYLMLYARIFSVTADIKAYLYFKETGAKPSNEFNGKIQQRDSLQRATEPLLEAPIPYSARAGSGGPSEIAISATYLLKDGCTLHISLRNLMSELLNVELVKGMCKLFYSYPDATALHFAVGRILIPYVELFISDPNVLDTICLQSSFIDVGQEFVKIVDCERSSWSSGLAHYVNLFRSIVRFAGGISDKILFTVDWRQLRPRLFERISNLIPFSIKKLVAAAAYEPNPTIRYLLQTGAITDLSTRLLDHSYELLLSKVTNQAAESSTEDFTDSSTVFEFTASNVDSTFLEAIVNGVSASPLEGSQDSIQTDSNEYLSFMGEFLINRSDLNPLDDIQSHT